MKYAGLQMFMEKLNQLINCTDIPFINNPSIICERPQFQLLYEELGSMIQTLFIDNHQDVEKLNDLKKTFMYAAEEAQYIVDLFLSGVHIRNSKYSPTSEDFNTSLNLDDVRRSFKSVEMEFMSMRADSKKILDSAPRTLNQSAASQTSITGDSLGSKKLSDEIFVGLDRDAEVIRDKLVEDQKRVDVVSIVGMGGIGKTTLATKVFNDGYVKHHFHVRVWVTVSQTYDKRDVLIHILESIHGQLQQQQPSPAISRVRRGWDVGTFYPFPDGQRDCFQIDGQLNLEKASDSRLREMVHKHLMGQRYLIVVDDIWHKETWDSLKLFFPHENNGSRILLTSRLTEVAKHANSDGLIHHLGYLNREKSWELLCQKVFHGNQCPKWSIKPGMEIVESCRGLPLAVVVIAGVLAKEAWSEMFWLEIAGKAGSYIVGEQNGCLDTLALSYNHLPFHLRGCFLYLGGFPADYNFQVKRLIWLWVAEGFIQQAGNKSLEDTAEGYLMDLIDRNLVIVAGRSKSNGRVKACKVHDLVRELCLKKAMEETSILQTDMRAFFSHFSNVITPPYKAIRLFINKDIIILELPHLSIQNLRSFLCLGNVTSASFDFTKRVRSFGLLRVLDLQKCKLNNFPEGMELLVHLRYLAIWKESEGFPTSICNLWSLRTLIYITGHSSIVLPSNLSDLINLRHCWGFYSNPVKIQRVEFFLPSIVKPMNLQTISGVELGDGIDNFLKCFPYIKELACTIYLDEENDFKSLTYLEKLELRGDLLRRMQSIMSLGKPIWRKNHITFPVTLKSLALHGCCLPWSDMSIIQSLPNLQVLKLGYYAFLGSCWNTNEQEFQQLKFLRLEGLDIEQWEAYSTSFPCLKQLEIMWCEDLEEIPFEIGDIPMLELIKIKKCRPSVGESVRRIQQEQHDLGNYDLKIDIIKDK